MKNIDLKKIFSKKKIVNEKNKKKISFEYVFRDWRFLTLAFAVILISLSLFAWNIYLSHQIGGGYLDLKKDDPTALVKTIDLKKLDNTISSLIERKIDFSNILSEGTDLSDPGR